jgi:hypothetical protein
LPDTSCISNNILGSIWRSLASNRAIRPTKPPTLPAKVFNIGEIQKLTAPRNAAVNMAVDIVHGVNRGLYPFKHIMQFPYSKLHYFKCYYLLFLPLKSLAIKG